MDKTTCDKITYYILLAAAVLMIGMFVALGFSGSPGFQGAQIARYRLTETNTAASTMRAR